MTLQRILRIDTSGPGLVEFTALAAAALDDAPGPGLLTLFAQHTSCSLLIQENADPDVRRDLDIFFRRLVPGSDHPDMGWITHTLEGPDDMPAHIKTALTTTTLTVPTRDGRMMLGTWQGIYLFEHRHAPHQRRVVAHHQMG
ncbi:MAG: secondary thiamine-phosphate synthase enzyme YjbQ [Pseudomonadota bacterium]